ncbi:MAG: PAS domain S-box protein [Proteobacteria bacterium]|nr:PAS domain S-box protein [Pseudomonadota bacterium]MBU1737260.1 PAS domain S-box protein [Pseudomonadota bacterium]
MGFLNQALDKYGKTGTTFFLSVLCVIASVLISFISWLVVGEPDFLAEFLVVAALCPGVIAPVVIYSYSSLAENLQQSRNELQVYQDRLEELVEERSRELTLANQALLESEAKLRSVTENSPDLILIVDQEANIRFINHTFSKRPTEEVVGTNLGDHFGEIDRDTIRKSFAGVIQTGSGVLELTLTTPDSIKRVLGCRVCRIVGQGDEPNFLVIVSDISERKKIEEELRKTQTIFNAFLENSPVYIFFKDSEIRPLMLSRNYEQLLGMPVEDILGKTMDEIFPSDLAKSMIEDDKQILSKGKVLNIVEELGGRIYETTKFPIFLNGTGNMLAGFTVDITERRKAEDERERLIGELRQALAEISTLRGILPICCFCKNVRNDSGYYEQIESYIHKHSGVDFSHTICPACMEKYYPDK